MISRVAPLLLALAALPVGAQALDSSLESLRYLGPLSPLVTNIERAVVRQASEFESEDSFERKSAPLSVNDLFPAYGFTPTQSFIEFNWTVSNDDVVRLCLSIPNRFDSDWEAFGFVREKHDLELSSSDCSTRRTFNLAALGHTFQVFYAYKDIDRNHSALPSKVSEGLTVHAVVDDKMHVAGSTKETPLATVSVPPGGTSEPVTLWIQNTSLLPFIRVEGADASEGWRFENNTCEVIHSGFGCSVDVVFTAPNDFNQDQAGQLRIGFNEISLEEAFDIQEGNGGEPVESSVGFDNVDLAFSVTMVAVPSVAVTETTLANEPQESFDASAFDASQFMPVLALPPEPDEESEGENEFEE